MVFIGIDPTAGKLPFVYAAIDNDLNIVGIGHGSVDDIMAYAASQSEAFVGVCAPRRPNQGFMADETYRQKLKPVPNPGRWLDFRVVEYLLRQHNIRLPRTASKEEDCPRWMQSGFQLYQRLESLGFRSCTEVENERQYGEIYPHASYCALLERIPFAKRTLEGRLQRQLILFENYLNITDPMRIFEEVTRYKLLKGILPFDDLYSQEELDALVAAYTVWHFAMHAKNTTIIGEPEEGQIILPVTELKDRYS